MGQIRQLTEMYVQAFHNQDINAISELLSEDFTLTDPENFELSPRDDVINYIQNIFDNTAEFISFEPRLIVVEHDTSIIHFTLSIGRNVFDGIDLISWENGKMKSMHAYLTQRQ